MSITQLRYIRVQDHFLKNFESLNIYDMLHNNIIITFPWRHICEPYYLRIHTFKFLSIIIDIDIIDSPCDCKAFMEYNSYNEFIKTSQSIQFG